MSILFLDARSPRQKLGAILFQNCKNKTQYEDIDFEDLANRVGVTPDELAHEIDILKIAEYVDHTSHGITFDRSGKRTDGGPYPWEKYRRVALTNNGILWAESKFPPITVPGATNVFVSMDVHIAIDQTITIINAADDVTQEQRDKVELLLKRLESELSKPSGKGRFSAVTDLLEAASAAKSLLEPVLGFLGEHLPEIGGLTDLA